MYVHTYSTEYYLLYYLYVYWCSITRGLPAQVVAALALVAQGTVGTLRHNAWSGTLPSRQSAVMCPSTVGHVVVTPNIQVLLFLVALILTLLANTRRSLNNVASLLSLQCFLSVCYILIKVRLWRWRFPILASGYFQSFITILTLISLPDCNPDFLSILYSRFFQASKLNMPASIRNPKGYPASGTQEYEMLSAGDKQGILKVSQQNACPWCI